MAKSWQYPRWRRILMQATLWVVLGATLGLAALVNYERRQAIHQALSDALPLGPLRVHVPRDWKAALGDGQSPAAVLQAREPGENGRVLTIEYQIAREAIPPLQHLADNGVALGDPADLAFAAPDLQRVEVAGWPGVMITDLRVGRSALMPMVQAPRAIIACAVLPSRDAVIVRLDGVGPSPQFDQQLVKQIAGAIEVVQRDPQRMESVERVELANGLRVVPPEGFQLVRRADPNRLSRQLILEQLPQRWTSLELIPCFFPPDHDGEDLLSLLWARNNDWWRGSVRQLSPRQWRADLPGSPFSSRAYLIADDETGHGLIALFHGMETDAGVYDQAWETLAASVSFPAGNPFPAMLDAGNRAVTNLRERDLADLLQGINEEQWWLWLHDSGTDVGQQREWYLGWTHLQHFHDPDKWSTRRHSMSRRFDRQVSELVQITESSDGMLGMHNSVVELYEASFNARPELEQTIHGRPDDMTLHLTLNGRRLPLIRMATPDAYLPGGWLSLLAGQLTEEPMILRTDALLGYEGLCPPRLLTLMIEPGESREIDGIELRCLTVSINGSGQVSRWYFDTSGELRRIEFAEGIVRRRSDRNEIASGFAGDRLLGRVGEDGFR